MKNNTDLRKLSPLGFVFKIEDSTYNVPTILAYKFSKSELNFFNQLGNTAPLMLDINFGAPCDLNCLYCYTDHGKVDRYDIAQHIKRLSDQELEKVIGQLGELGCKVVFFCSEGDPLFQPERLLHFARLAKESNLRSVLYTNATGIDKKLAKKLHELDINLVLKLESLSIEVNDRILGSRGKYEYKEYKGKLIPKQLIAALKEYETDLGKIAVSSMITKMNISSLLSLRKWAYEDLGISHFLKEIYIFGQADKNKDILLIPHSELRIFEQEVYGFDQHWGFSYPTNVPDLYSFDIRRFLNNYLSKERFPARIFGHPRGGVFCSTDSLLPVKFGFKDGHFVSMRDEHGKINMRQYFEAIYQTIIENTGQNTMTLK